MKKIGVDCRFAATHSGLGRYTRELVTHLLKRDDPVHYTLFVRSTHEAWCRELASVATLVEAPFPHYSWAEQRRLPGLLRAAQIELFFAPHFNVPWHCPVPFVVTIHDLILHRYPNQASFLKRLAYRALMRRSIAKAQMVIAVSAFTAQEIAAIYGKTAPVVTIPEGISASFTRCEAAGQERVRQRYSLRRPFFLYVGNAKEHKNVQVLIDAFADAQLDESELVLVCSGKEAQRLQLAEGVRLLSDVADDDLPALYSAARAFVTASLYEGFCLPVLEARACACPVIASHCGAIPEVAGQEACVIEPTKEQLVTALEGASQLSAPAGLQSQYSWEAAAEKTADVLLSAE